MLLVYRGSHAHYLFLVFLVILLFVGVKVVYNLKKILKVTLRYLQKWTWQTNCKKIKGF